MTIHPDLIIHLRTTFALDWFGIHGAPYWSRVRPNGLKLAESTGARTRVVELFAFLYDVRRSSEGHDPQHGRREAQMAAEPNGHFFELPSTEPTLLQAACRGLGDCHLAGDDATVSNCRDADWQDLDRIGIRPLAGRLCTAAARQRQRQFWRGRAGEAWLEAGNDGGGK